MLKNGIPPGGGRANSAYIGSYQESLAKERVHRMEINETAETSFNQGRQQGYDEGYDQGWEKAIEAGNKELNVAAGYIRQHVKDKEELRAKLNERADLINKLAARIDELEKENEVLKKDSEQQRKENSGLRELVTSLRSTTERLQGQVDELDAKYKARTQQYVDLLWQYNRTMVVVSAVSSVLDELTKENTPQAREARAMFTKHYAQEVRNGLERGTIKEAPDLDPVFKRMLPRTQALISDLLTGPIVPEATDPGKEEMSLGI